MRGHRHLRQFVRQNQAWLAERAATTRTVASTCEGGRAVVELVAELTQDGDRVSWPLAVVAESADDRSAVFRTYCSQWPVDGRRHVRPPLLEPRPIRLAEAAARYQDALAKGDVETLVGAFAPGGYLRDSLVPPGMHQGPAELRSYFVRSFAAGGGVSLQPCVATDDGVRCAVEYNCARWGSYDLPPQAGIMVLERDRGSELVAAVRVYDDIEAPTPGGDDGDTRILG